MDPTPSTMGREFDRHHPPQAAPRAAVAPGRIGEPVEAPGARSGLPILHQPQAEAGQNKASGACPETGITGKPG